MPTRHLPQRLRLAQHACVPGVPLRHLLICIRSKQVPALQVLHDPCNSPARRACVPVLAERAVLCTCSADPMLVQQRRSVHDVPHARWQAAVWVRPARWRVRALQGGVLLQRQRARGGEAVHPLCSQPLLPVEADVCCVRGHADIQAWRINSTVHDSAHEPGRGVETLRVQLQHGWRLRSISLWEPG